MIPTKNEVSIQSNMQGREHVLRFDENAILHLMTILTNMYPDPEGAVIREYSSNARDSHIEARIDEPIEVITPSFDGVLRIIDHGVGLDEQDIETVYSLYGASTKRDTNAQTGMLGIGAKSALAYTSQFTVIGIKDGIRTVVNVSKDDDHAGTMTIVETGKTEERNGVEIAIPVDRHNSFEEKAKNLFKYWPEGSVLLNGEPPVAVEGINLTDNIMFVKKENDYDEDVILMGDVPYEIPGDVHPFEGLASQYKLVVRVEIGSVNFTPARDSLMITKRTKDRMEKLGKEIFDALTTSVQKDINSSESYFEVLRKLDAWRQALKKPYEKPLDNLTYRGVSIPEMFESSTRIEREEVAQPIFIARYDSEKPGENTRTYKVKASVVARALMVYGYYADKFTPSHKKKLVIYADSNDFDIEYFVLSAKPLQPSGWIDSDRVVHWNDIKDIKIPRPIVTGSRLSIVGTYPIAQPDREYLVEEAAANIDSTKPIYYFDTTTFTAQGYYRRDRGQEALERIWREAIALCRAYEPDCTIVRLGLNRINKFLRDFPEARPLKGELQTKIKVAYDGLGVQVHKAWRLQENDVSLLRRLDPTKIEDPDLRDAIRLAKMEIKDKIEPFRFLQRGKLRGNLIFDFNHLQRGISAYDIQICYPLLKNSSDGYRINDYMSHVYIYLETVYQLILAPERKAA